MTRLRKTKVSCTNRARRQREKKRVDRDINTDTLEVLTILETQRKCVAESKTKGIQRYGAPRYDIKGNRP